MLIEKFKGINSEELFNVAGGTNMSEGMIKFQQDVKHLLETPLGSVLGNLNYGSKLYQLLFLPVSESTGTLIQEEIQRTIEVNYADIKVVSIDITFGKRTKLNKCFAVKGVFLFRPFVKRNKHHHRPTFHLKFEFLHFRLNRMNTYNTSGIRVFGER